MVAVGAEGDEARLAEEGRGRTIEWGAWCLSASSIKAGEGKEVGRRELESKPGAEEETEAVDRKPEEEGEAWLVDWLWKPEQGFFFLIELNWIDWLTM